MTPEPARSKKSHLPGALSSPSTPEEAEEFWRDLGRSLDANFYLRVPRIGMQMGNEQPKGEDDGWQ